MQLIVCADEPINSNDSIPNISTSHLLTDCLSYPRSIECSGMGAYFLIRCLRERQQRCLDPCLPHHLKIQSQWSCHIVFDSGREFEPMHCDASSWILQQDMLLLSVCALGDTLPRESTSVAGAVAMPRCLSSDLQFGIFGCTKIHFPQFKRES